MVLTKFGFSPSDVWKMSHLEANSWISAHLTHLGVKPKQVNVRFNPETTIISQRKQHKGA